MGRAKVRLIDQFLGRGGVVSVSVVPSRLNEGPGGVGRGAGLGIRRGKTVIAGGNLAAAPSVTYPVCLQLRGASDQNLIRLRLEVQIDPP